MSKPANKDSESVIKQTYVEKSIETTINIGNFESLKIRVLLGENVKWENEEEKQEALEEVNRNLVRELKADVENVVNSCGLEGRIDASVVNNIRKALNPVTGKLDGPLTKNLSVKKKTAFNID